MARNKAQGAGVRKAMANLEALPTFDAEGAVHVIVEAPRSSRVKCKYDSDLGAFVLGKPLPHGVTYPFDWGFIPSTKGEDGDPLDALVLHDAACPVGCVIACRRLPHCESARSREAPMWKRMTASSWCPSLEFKGWTSGARHCA